MTADPSGEARDGEKPGGALEILGSRPVLAVLLVAGLGVVFRFAPAPLDRLALFGPQAPSHEAAPVETAAPLGLGEAELAQDSETLPGMAAPTGKTATSKQPALYGGSEAPLEPIATTAPPVPIFDPTGHSLDAFFRALARTQRKEPGALTRIAHFGDSVVVSDYVTGTLRRRLQETFGDGGHGYMLIANPWPAYFHNDVFRFATKGFRVSRIVGPLTADGWYGLGGVTFRASDGVVAQFGTAEKGDYGKNVSRFTLSYAEFPHGGVLKLSVDGGAPLEIDTNGAEKRMARRTIDVPDGPHRFELSVRGGETRTFGVVLERAGPGVVLDALGVQGARVRFLDKQDDAHFAEELAWRKPDLVAFQFGANESGDGYAYPMDEYLTTMKAIISQAQAAVPESSCLIVGAMDRARVEDGVTVSMKIIQLIVAEQRKAAEQLGCAYFDTFTSMGGAGSMPAWVKRGLGQADMTHPSGVGAERIAGWLYAALLERYDAFRKAQ